MYYFYLILILLLFQDIFGYEAQEFGSFSMTPLPDNICDIPSTQCSQFNLTSSQLKANQVNVITAYGFFTPLLDSDTSTLFQIYDKNQTNLRFEIKVQPQLCLLYIKTLQDVDNSLVVQQITYSQFNCDYFNPQPFEFLISLNYQDKQNISQGYVNVFLNFNGQGTPFYGSIIFPIPVQNYLSSTSVLQVCQSKIYGNLKNLRVIYNYEINLDYSLIDNETLLKLIEKQSYLKGSLQPASSPIIYKMDYYHNFQQYNFYDLYKQKIGKFDLSGLLIPLQKLSSVHLVYNSGFHLPLQSADLKSSPIEFGLTMNLNLKNIYQVPFKIMLKVNFNEGTYSKLEDLEFLLPTPQQIQDSQNSYVDTFTVGMFLRFDFNQNMIEIVKFNEYTSQYSQFKVSDSIEYFYLNYKILSLKDIQIYRINPSYNRRILQSPQSIHLEILDVRVYQDKFGIEFLSQTQETFLHNCNIATGIQQKICVRCQNGFLLNHNGTCSTQCDEGYYKLGRDCIKTCAYGTYDKNCIIPADCNYLSQSINPSCENNNQNCLAKFGNQCFQCTNSTIQYQSQCLDYDTAQGMSIFIYGDNLTAIDFPLGYVNSTHCDQNNQYYQQDQECVQECSVGYFLNETSSQCERCYNMIYYNKTNICIQTSNQNCLLYNQQIPESCLVCENGYKLNEFSRCIKEVENCHEYSANNNCIKCNDGYFLQFLENQDGENGGGGGGVAARFLIGLQLSAIDQPSICVKQCSPSYVLDYTNLQCILLAERPPPCLVKSGLRCLKCDQDFHLECGQCIMYDTESFNNTNLLPINGRLNNNSTENSCRYNYTMLNNECYYNYPPDGYFQDLETEQILSCDQSCFKCQNLTSCLVQKIQGQGCQKGFFQQDQGCYPCSYECSECSGPNNGQCQKCTDGYVLSGNTCVIQFPTTHKSIMIDNSKNCLQFNQTTSQCERCISNIVHLYVDQYGECSTYCFQDYPIADTVNLKCVQQCPEGTLLDNSNPEQQKCTQCGVKKYYDGASCQNCSDINCAQCSNGNTCDLCDSGSFYLTDENQCIKCSQPNCQACSNDQTCLKCSEGYDLIKGEGTSCENKCPQYQYRDQIDNTCKQCISNCNQCLDDNTCVVCNEGFEFLTQTQQCSPVCLTNQFRNAQGVCIECALSNCELCTNLIQCSVCKPGNFLDQHKLCISNQCSDGQFFDFNKLSCQNCSTGCKKCISLDKCYECQKSNDPSQNYFLSPVQIAVANRLLKQFQKRFRFVQDSAVLYGNCFIQCTNQQYPDKTNNICCDPTCLTCDGFQSNNCLSCPPSYSLQSDIKTCQISCKLGEYISDSSSSPVAALMLPPSYDSVLQKCKKCLPECETCSNGNSCTTCKVGYYLQNDQCVQQCTTGQYRLDPIQHKVCCDLSCDSCFNSSDTGCINCFDELYSIDKTSQKCTYDKIKAEKLQPNKNITNTTTDSVAIPKLYCHWSCSKCSDFEYDSCQECVSPERIFYRGTCSCPPGYEDIGSTCEPSENQGDKAFISLNYIVLISFFAFTLSGKYPLFSINVLFISQFAGYFTYFQEPANVYNKDYIYKAFNIDNLAYFFPNPLKSSFLRNVDPRYDQEYIEMHEQIPNDFRYILNEKSQNFLFNVFPLILFFLPFCVFYLVSRFAKEPSNSSQNRFYWLYGKILQALRMSMQWNVFLLIMIFSYQEIITFLALQFQHIDTSNGINTTGMLFSFVGVAYAAYVPAIIYYGINVASFDKHTKYGVLFMNCINDTSFSGKNQLLVMLIFKAAFAIIFASGDNDKGSSILLILLIYGIYRVAEIALNFRTTQRSKIYLLINLVITLLIFILAIYAYSLSKYRDANLSKFYSYDFAQSQIKAILVFIFTIKVLVMIVEMVALLFFYSHVQYVYHKDFQWPSKSSNIKNSSSSVSKGQPKILIDKETIPQVSDQVINGISKMLNQTNTQTMNNPFLMLYPNANNSLEMSLTSQMNANIQEAQLTQDQSNTKGNSKPQSEYNNSELCSPEIKYSQRQTPTDNNMINSYEDNKQNPFLIQNE